MRTLRILLPVLCALALGCRVNPNQVLLEQEARLIEDRVWELQACLEDAHAAREATLRENEELKKKLSGKGSDNDTGPSIDLKDRPARPRRSPTGSGTTPSLEPPKIELPDMPDSTESDTTPGVDLGPAPGPGDEGASVREGQPTELIINKRATGGLDRDGAAGAEGIVVAVEPRDAQGRLVKGPGEVSVAVLDPSLDGDASRVARWDFDAEQIQQHFTRDASAPGLRFSLAWPNEPPKNRNLKLYVRYTTPDGRKIMTESPLSLDATAARPMLSRRDEDRASGETKRPPAKRVPGSRLKRMLPGSRTAKEPGPRDSADTEAPRWDSERAGTAPQREPVEQAQRPERPEWKPYR